MSCFRVFYYSLKPAADRRGVRLKDYSPAELTKCYGNVEKKQTENLQLAEEARHLIHSGKKQSIFD